jgi:hypothetical protein
MARIMVSNMAAPRARTALAGLGIDNLHVDLSGPELPIMDGSAAPFVFLLQSAGVLEQDARKRFIRVVKPIELHDGDKWVRLEPHSGFRITLSIDFAHPATRGSAGSVSIDPALLAAPGGGPPPPGGVVVLKNGCLCCSVRRFRRRMRRRGSLRLASHWA